MTMKTAHIRYKKYTMEYWEKYYMSNLSNMTSKELERKLVEALEAIDAMREIGMEDQDIIRQLGLSTVELGTGTRSLLRAIKSGKVKETDTLQSIAKAMGWKSHTNVIYHLDKLKKHGFIGK